MADRIEKPANDEDRLTLNTVTTARRLAMQLIVVAGVLASLTLASVAHAAPSGAAGGGATASPPSLSALQSQAGDVRATMRQLEAEMVTLTERWDAARRDLDDATRRLMAARRLLERAESDLEQKRLVVEARVVLMYKAGEYSWVDILATSSSMADAEVQLEVMGRLAELDRGEEEEFQRLASEARRLEDLVEAERVAAVEAQATIDARRAEMDAMIAERAATLKDVVAQIKKILSEPELIMESGGKVTQLTWAKAFLKSISMPMTVDNVAAVVAWEMAEGGHWYNTAHFNPLNTSQPMPGARTFNSHGVKIYTSWAQGLKATVITINNGFYGRILAALRAGNDGQAVATAVAASPWGTGPFAVRE